MGNLFRHGVEMYRQTINLKDSPQEPEKVKLPDSLTAENKYKKVAKFLILIGSEHASGILAGLEPNQVSEISKEIALTKTIKPEEREEILAEFHALFSKSYGLTGSSQGGIETARRILYAAKGPKKGEELLNKAIPASKENLFSFLEEFSPEQLVMLLKDETDQTAALILARVSAKLSAGTLSKLPSSRKPGILKRMAHQGEVFPEVLEQVSLAFKEKVRHISGGAKDVEIDGMQALAAILKQGDYSFGDRLINELEAEDPSIGKNLKEKLYTLEDVVNSVDRPIQDKLKTMSEIDIALLLKGRGDEFTEKILSCVSAGRRKIIRDEYDLLGPVPKRDCDAAARDFLSWFRLARERGEIILYSDEDVFV
ncbi:MAG: flagellar motor switch protein FliG [Treponema sp.]|nr:flagellar motor switch protein FliG [Treponema sp.]